MADKNAPPVSTKSPEPLQMHVDHAESVARRERAIRLVMAQKQSDGKYPEWNDAAEIVDAKGVDSILADADRAASGPSAERSEPAKVGAPDHDDIAAVQARADGAAKIAQDAINAVASLEGRCNRLESRIVALESAAQPKAEAASNKPPSVQ